jgi:hypothetical protein
MKVLNKFKLTNSYEGYFKLTLNQNWFFPFEKYFLIIFVIYNVVLSLNYEKKFE